MSDPTADPTNSVNKLAQGMKLGNKRVGPPANFPGVVLPNPDNIKPRWDTEPGPATRLSDGARLTRIPTAVGKQGSKKAPFDISNPAKNQIEPNSLKLREF